MKAVTRNIVAGLAVIVMATVSIGPAAEARKIKTKHTIPKVSAKDLEAEAARNSEKENVVSMESDSIAFSDRILPAIRFYGFDKTVGSSIESFFISNGLEETLAGVEVEITYLDMKGRQLHKRSVKIDCDIPAGETKRTDVKSWDTQKSFYFHQSVKPKRQATPFNVQLSLVSVSFPEK